MRSAVLAVLALMLVAGAARAAESWRAADWGMTPGALDAAVPGLETLDPPWRYGGGLSASRALRRTEIAGLEVRALFQTGPDGRLAQILFERRRPDIDPADGRRILDALRARHGRETRFCLDLARPRGPVSAHALWRLPTRTLHLTWLDFGTGDGLDRIAEAEIRRRLREGDVAGALERRREGPAPGAIRRSLPRRLLIRIADPARPGGGGACPPRPEPRPAAPE
ncbi:MAG: hypothetical protein R6V44_09575 [Paracoccaceae bacterium]